MEATGAAVNADPDAGPASADRRRVITLGCRLNTYESEVIRGHLAAAEAECPDGPETVVVNTCAVTAEAERQARQTIRRIKRDRPECRVVVTGCSAQIDPDRYTAMAEVDHVVGNAEKLRPETWSGMADAATATQRALVNDIGSVRDTAQHLVDGFTDRTRGFVQVQQGCDHRCTFCIIPYGRGPSRSVPVAEVVRQIQALVGNGTREVVLSGVDITSYGGDLPGKPVLGHLVQAVLRHVPDLPRLRLSSLDCIEVDEALWDVIANDHRFMPHLHLSLQSGDPMILKRMKRRHTPDEAVALTERARRIRPDIVFGADLIAGFPTETGEMAANTLAAIDACGLTWVHVFPYSERPGTPAARMPQIPGNVRKARAAALRQAAAAAQQRFLDSRVGCHEMLLIENSGLGRTEQFATARLVDGPAPAGSLIAAVVIGHDDGVLQTRRAVCGPHGFFSPATPPETTDVS